MGTRGPSQINTIHSNIIIVYNLKMGSELDSSDYNSLATGKNLNVYSSSPMYYNWQPNVRATAALLFSQCGQNTSWQILQKVVTASAKNTESGVLSGEVSLEEMRRKSLHGWVFPARLSGLTNTQTTRVSGWRISVATGPRTSLMRSNVQSEATGMSAAFALVVS